MRVEASLPVAVHISANVLTNPCWIGGFVVLALLLAFGLARLRDEEIPRLALLTAALFVASSIHIPLGLFSVHLLLNGVAGLLLGRRCLVAIPMATLLQAWLLGHGDLTTWGVNSCIMSLPALTTRWLFRWYLNASSTGCGAAMVALGCLFHPWSWLVTGPLVLGLRRLAQRQPRTVVGSFLVCWNCVLLTALLQAAVLTWGGEADFSVIAVMSLAMHTPLAFLEGAISAILIPTLFLARPHWLEAWLPASHRGNLPPTFSPNRLTETH
jgi:cobalt/nickel transport system permease protein